MSASPERITSRSNPLIARMRKLAAERKFRREEGVFLCEGPKMLLEAIRWEAGVETVLHAEGVSLPAMPNSVRLVVETPADLLRSVALTENPQGVVFTCKGNDLTLPKKLKSGRWLVLDGVQDPGNVGTIWRTADAFGASGLILCNSCDPWNPKVIRATMGAAFRLPVYEGMLGKAVELLSWAGLPIYAAALRRRAVDVRRVDLSRCAMIIGSEGKGVSLEALKLCDRTVKIPMMEQCESLNAAMAASVILWEGFCKAKPSR